jgi:ABC-type transporter Mla subunit MlaD
MSAEIIPFPTAQAAQPSLAPPRAATPAPVIASRATPRSAGEDRLQRALEALDAAVTGQRAAVAEWRRSLEQLGTTMNGLGTSLGRYRDSLTNLEGQVESLNRKAVALEQWADQALTAKQG